MAKAVNRSGPLTHHLVQYPPQGRGAGGEGKAAGLASLSREGYTLPVSHAFMDDELVLFTSYFNLSGGRRQDTADTFRVDPNLSSTSSPDGAAALYIVTEASMSGHMGPRARRVAADVVAWEYASHGDDAPAPRLKAALRAAHDAVLREFDGHVAVGMSVMAVEQDTVYLGQVAPAQVYVLHEGSLHSISASAEGTSPFSGALGAQAGAQVSVFRDQIGPEDIVALCSSWYHRGADAEDLRACFGAGTADDIAESMLELAKQHGVQDTTVIVVEAALASEVELEAAADAPPTVMEQVDSAVQALAGVGRLLWSELRSHPAGYPEDGRNGRAQSPIPDFPAPEAEPAGQQAAEPLPHAGARPAYGDEPTGEPVRAQTATQEDTDHAEPSVAESRRQASRQPGAPAATPQETGAEESSADSAISPGSDQATEEVPIVSPETVSREVPAVESDRPRSRARDEAVRSSLRASIPPRGHAGREQAREPDGSRATKREPVSELDQVNSRIQNDPDLGDVIPPVQAFPDTSTEPERIYATSKDMQKVNKRPRRFGGARPVGRDPLSGPAVIRPGLGDLDLRRPASRPAPPAVIWFSIAVVFVLAVVAGYLYFHRPHRAVAANPYPKKFNHNIALAVAAKNPSVQDAYLSRARQDITLAREFGSKPKALAGMRLRWQMTSDDLHHVARQRAPLLLSNFGQFPGAQPTEIAASPSMVLVLDAGRKSVFSVTPYSTSNPALILQDGETDSGFTIGMPKHIATDGATALVLDDHNVLVRDAAGVKTAASLPQITQTPQNVVTLGTSDPDVYLLDTANNQLWRYPSAVSGFNPEPAEYFTPGTPNTPTLTHAVWFAFDQNALYILQGNGSVQKFDLQANPERFAVNLHTPLQKPLSIFTGPGLNFVWIADPANSRIVQFDKSGSFIRTFRSGTAEMDFSQIRSFAVSSDGHTMYVLCGAKLFAFPVPR